MTDRPTETVGDTQPASLPEPDAATVEALERDLATITADSQSDPAVDDISHLFGQAQERGLLESSTRELTRSDAAEAFVGSVIFASPLLVEDGVFDIADHLFGFTLFGVPVFLIANTLFVVLMTYALLEWTGRNREDTRQLFGVIPLRLFMVLGISFVVAAMLMTVWGRVGGWQARTEAIARINVIWTVGSLGAALGDILSDRSEPPGTEATPTDEDRQLSPGAAGGSATESSSSEPMSDAELLDALEARFEDLQAAVEDGDRREVAELRERTVDAALDDTFGDEINKYTSRDVAEAFVGSIFFAVPFLVEDGVFDVAAYFLSFQIGLFPVFFLLNAGFVVLMILALVYWAGPQDVQVSRPIFGVVPRRLVGIAIVSFVTAAALMTMWGRVGNWSDPVVALARISVVWTAASFGASLGDILPGESSGDDINDDLAALTDGPDPSGAESRDA